MNVEAKSVMGPIAKKGRGTAVRAGIADLAARRAFGKLLEDRRHAAGFSRLKLAQRAQVSDATVKFVEKASISPSRKTLIRLIGVEELGLGPNDCPGLAACPPELAGGPSQAVQDGLRLEKLLRLIGCTLAAKDKLGCRPVHAVVMTLTQLLGLPEDRVQLGAKATLVWQLGAGPAPLLAGYQSADTTEQVLRLARLGAAAADPADPQGPYGWFRGVELALVWIRDSEAPSLVRQMPTQAQATPMKNSRSRARPVESDVG